MGTLSFTAPVLLALSALVVTPVQAEGACDVHLDVCAEANMSGTCVLVWAATHAFGPCVDPADPEGSAWCTLENQCIDEPDPCDTGGDVCFEANTSGTCTMAWLATHPGGACVEASHRPAATVCTFSSCTRL